MLKTTGVAVAAILATGCVERVEQPTQAQLAARGEYLVIAIGGCNDCHTPMTMEGPDMAQSLQGATIIFAPAVEMPWATVAPPLAGGPAGYTDVQFASFLQDGVRPDGSHPLPPMPVFRLNEDDARAVVAYIKTVPPASPSAP